MLRARCSMQIKILYFNGCPNWETAAVRVRTVLAELDRADVVVELEDVHQAAHLSSEWRGSPTVLLDGRDPFAAPNEPPPVWKGRRFGPPSDDQPIHRGLPPVLARDACRIYVTEAGLEAVPSLDQLRTALTALKDRPNPRRN